ncbi:MAG: DUF4239 domain-containing protein [Candidatus Eremiobacteraeota bacterium]|nr:DUF4239 domain-containing protein [Candidatus Eremiobacteraeota bacterium]
MTLTEWLQSLHTSALAVVIVGGFLAATLVAGYLVGRFTSREIRLQHNDLAGFILAVIGVVYAVLLGFVAIGVWERFENAESRTYDEAANLTVVYRDASSFPQGHQLRAGITRYAQTVIDEEWPKMLQGSRSLAARREVEALDLTVRSLPVNNAREQNIHAEMLQAMDTTLGDRDERTSIDAHGINVVMWVVLALGAFITVGFTYLFGFRQTLMQQLMIGSLSVLIGLMLFLTFSLDYPFRGDIAVAPDAFENALRTFALIGR